MVGKQEAAAGHVVATIKKPKESTAATPQSVSFFSFSLGPQPVVLQIQGVFFHLNSPTLKTSLRDTPKEVFS